MTKQFLIIIFLSSITYKTIAQGCVAIKSNGGYCMEDHNMSNNKWSLAWNTRYFKSFRHFIGTTEQKLRITNGTEVINHSVSNDFILTKTTSKGLTFNVQIPIISNRRSSLYEHDGKNRYTTSSFGIGDTRISVGKWLLHHNNKGNVQMILGLKLPTGDYKYQDYFVVNDTTKVIGPVDQSIQLGDGGTGFTTEVNAYYKITKKLTAYANAYYLLNPREQNGVSTSRGRTVAASAVRYTTDVMSVPDQYMIRAGFDYSLKTLKFSLGVRDERLPAHDLIGGSRGFRRPGYIISAEPGITWQMKKVSLYYYMPYALKRDRLQSVPDKIRTAITGVYAQGDAAFADYTVNVGAIIHF